MLTATSALVSPARLARSGSIATSTAKLSAPQSWCDPLGVRVAPEDAHELGREGAQRGHVVPAEPDRDRHPDRRPHLELAHVHPRAGTSREIASCSAWRESRRIPLVPPLHHDQAVVGLPRLRAEGEPEPRPAPADEGGERDQPASPCWPPCCSKYSCACRLINPSTRSVAAPRRAERRVLRQPDLGIREVLEVLGEELGLELAHDPAAQGEKAEGRDRHLPPVLGWPSGPRGSTTRRSPTWRRSSSGTGGFRLGRRR